MVKVILVPGVPRIVRTALSRDMPRTGLSSRRVIRSPAWSPARSAGLPSIGFMTLTKPSSEVISIPRPANLPVVCSCISSKSFLSKNVEWGSKLLTMPFTASVSNCLSSIGSTYSRLIWAKTFDSVRNSSSGNVVFCWAVADNWMVAVTPAIKPIAMRAKFLKNWRIFFFINLNSNGG